MSDTRTPYDGHPYYCQTCGCGLAEYYACELPDCKIESEQAAKKRAAKRLRTRVLPRVSSPDSASPYDLSVGRKGLRGMKR